MWLTVIILNDCRSCKAKIKKETNDDRPLDKITVRAFCNNNWVRFHFTS